ncbi:NAD-dependent epimerase/dehydratase family protein [Salinisphaera sp. Q1T1-3]|uniref:NAD-dependent epimerase/dehydratase family protein n=1 Tax=Salinisphaera sp. Q1T1-3 TaxID=2321229 RepID=UPI000E76D29B|nr:NAD-dependent epimerase/dehydratase family protein [Salinisphaera sp. Q1T1-3]RJS92893.1 NAD-dependent epimerase/dehydratase family protein [Salinisphaera sp. Q1T1-3]
MAERTRQETRRQTAARRKTPARRDRADGRKAATATDDVQGIGHGHRGKVMVTGAAGALAQHVIAELIEHDYDVVGVEFRGVQHEYPDTVDYVVDFNQRPFEDVFREHDFVGVVHLGRIRFTQSTRGRRYSANVVGTSRLLGLAKKYGVTKVLALSTYHVYGADARNPSLIDEEHPMRAANLMPEIVDAVELENLFNIHLYKDPELNIVILRPCNIAGPGINNEISRMLGQSVAPCLVGFSPLMQFIHVADMSRAVLMAFEQNHPGVYNVAPNDYVTYQDALQMAGCRRLFLPSVPPRLARRAVRALGRLAPPAYLIDFFKYSVIIDGSLFARTFDFAPEHSLSELFAHYRAKK